MLTKEEQKKIEDAQPIIGDFVKTHYRKQFQNDKEFYKDLVSESNLIISEKIHTYDSSKGKMTTWIHTILSTYLRNYVTKFYSKNSEIHPYSIEDIKDYLSSASLRGNDETDESKITPFFKESMNQSIDMDRYVEAKILRSHIEKIPDKFGRCLELYIDGFTVEEIAKELGTTTRNVYHYKDIAIKKLFEIIKRDGFFSSVGV